MKKLLLIPLLALTAACNTGTYELETPDKDITIEFWKGAAGMNDFVRIDDELHEVNVEVNKADPDDWGADNTGKSGFRVEDLDGNVIVNFVCTRERMKKYQDDPNKTECVRWEVDSSSFSLVPVGTEYRKS